MNTKKSGNNGPINLAEFDKLEEDDSYKLESLILKIRESKFFHQIPDWIVNYPIPQGTRPCPWNVARCMTAVLKMQKERAINIHPIHQLDLCVAETNVCVNPEGVTMENPAQTSLGVATGYLVANLKDSVRIMNACTSEIAAVDAKYDKAGNLNPPEWPVNFAVPVADCNNIRVALKNTKSSKSIARDEMFAELSNPYNTIQSVRLHSSLAKHLANFTEVPALTSALDDYYVKTKLKKPNNLKGYAVGVDNGDLPFSDNLITAYKYYFKSVSIRGGRDGKGIDHGFERFTMSRTMSNTLNLVQDFLNMAEEYGTKFVIVRDSKYLSTEEIRVLVHNGFRIILITQNYGKCGLRSDPGVYSSSDPNLNTFEFILLAEEGVRPVMSTDQITLGKYYDDALAKISSKKKMFSYVYLDNRLKKYEQTMCLLPSCTADTLRVICATGVKKTFSIDALTKRATMAISCRNRFLHTRKPFFTMDIMSDFVRWKRVVKYPRLRAVEEEKFLDLGTMKGSDSAGKVIPMAINVDHFLSIVEQAQVSVMTIEDICQDALDQNPEYLCRVFFGNMKGAIFKFVDDDGAAWKAKYDPILNLDEDSFLRLLGRLGYREVWDDVVVELEPEEGSDLEDDEVGKEQPDDSALQYDFSAFANIDLTQR